MKKPTRISITPRTVPILSSGLKPEWPIPMQIELTTEARTPIPSTRGGCLKDKVALKEKR
jgi:hypothetical protein